MERGHGAGRRSGKRRCCCGGEGGLREGGRGDGSWYLQAGDVNRDIERGRLDGNFRFGSDESWDEVGMQLNQRGEGW